MTQIVEKQAPTEDLQIRRMKVLAVGAQKGGVAKTTTSLYLAARAAERLGSTAGDPKVGLLDRDRTSKNLTKLLSLREDDLPGPGVILLDGEELPRRDCGLDLVIIDTPPGMEAIDSLASADMLVVTVVPSEQGVINLRDYLKLLDANRITYSPGMRLLALLPTIVRPTTAHRESLEIIRRTAAQHRPPLPVLPAIPCRNSIDTHDLSAPEYDAPAKELFDYAGF